MNLNKRHIAVIISATIISANNNAYATNLKPYNDITTCFTGCVLTDFELDGQKLTVRGSDSHITNATLKNGAELHISSGTATNTIIESGSANHVKNHAVAENTVIYDGLQIIHLASTAFNTTIHNRGMQIVDEDSTAYDTTINGGRQIVGHRQGALLKGVVNNTVINGGLQEIWGTGTTIDTIINGGESWIQTGGLADGETLVNANGTLTLDAGARATDANVQGGTVQISALTPEMTGHSPAQIDKLTLNDGNVAFLRGGDGDFAALNISELSGTGNFLFNSSLADRGANFVTIENGTGQFGVIVADSGKEIADHTNLTVNLIHDQGGDVDFALTAANGRSTGAIDGGTYMYTLYSAQDKDGLNDGNVWYLGAMDNNGGETPGGGGENPGGETPGGGGGLTTTPSTDAILNLSNAGLNILRGELDGLRAYRNTQSAELKHEESTVWGHYLGKKSNVDTSNGAAYTLHQNGFELGGDTTTQFTVGHLVTGWFVTLSDNNVNHARGGKSQVDSYGLGAYATWYDNHGFYVDGALKVNRLESKLNARMTNGGSTSGKWHQYGITSAVESGYTFRPSESLRVEPFLRLTGTHINAANVQLNNGMTGNTGKARSLTAEAGGRLGTAFTLGKTHFAPYLSASVEQEFVKSNQTTINGTHHFDNNVNGTSGKYGAGASVMLSANTTLYGEANYRQGSYVEDPIQGVAGIRIGF